MALFRTKMKGDGHSARRRNVFSPSYQLPVPAHEEFFDQPRRNDIQHDDAGGHDKILRRRRQKSRRLSDRRKGQRRQHGESAQRQDTDRKRGKVLPGKALRTQKMHDEHLREDRFDKPSRAEQGGECFLSGTVQRGIGRAARHGTDRKVQEQVGQDIPVGAAVHMGQELLTGYHTTQTALHIAIPGLFVIDRVEDQSAVKIENPGDTDLLPGDTVDIRVYEEANTKAIQEGGVPATAKRELQSITKASLTTESFLSAASFQESSNVLTEAALKGKVDHLRGLKENIIIGKMIPAGTGAPIYRNLLPKQIKDNASMINQDVDIKFDDIEEE